MKKLLLLTVISIVIASISHAQITKGTILLGGDLSATFQKTDSEPRAKYTSYYINPALGFTVKDNHVLGFNATFGHSNSSYQQTRDERDTYGAGVFYRRYLTLGKGFYLFGQANAGYSQEDADRYSHSTFAGDKHRQHTVGVNLYPGITYTVNKRIHLELGMNNLVGLNYSTRKEKHYYPGFYSESKSSGFNFRTNTNPDSHLSIGFRIALGKK
jgi:hypothetical protein